MHSTTQENVPLPKALVLYVPLKSWSPFGWGVLFTKWKLVLFVTCGTVLFGFVIKSLLALKCLAILPPPPIQNSSSLPAPRPMLVFPRSCPNHSHELKRPCKRALWFCLGTNICICPSVFNCGYLTLLFQQIKCKLQAICPKPESVLLGGGALTHTRSHLS